jgi:hypothetical protein
VNSLLSEIFLHARRLRTAGLKWKVAEGKLRQDMNIAAAKHAALMADYSSA